VALMGRIFTMPGLPRVPAATKVTIGDDGVVRGLMQNEVEPPAADEQPVAAS
jgi:hypothetical protein